MTQVTFTRMDDATAEELAVVVAEAQAHLHGHLVDAVIGMLDALKGPTLGYAVDRYEHSLQTASRAHREGARTDMVVAALLHDVGDPSRRRTTVSWRRRSSRPTLTPNRPGWSAITGSSRATTTGIGSGWIATLASATAAIPTSTPPRTSAARGTRSPSMPRYDTLPIDTFVPMLREVFSRPASGFGVSDD